MEPQSDGARIAVYRSTEAAGLVADLAHLYRLDLIRRGAPDPDSDVSGFVDRLERTLRIEGTVVITAGVDAYLVGFLVASPQPRPQLAPGDSDLGSLAVDTLAFAASAARALPDVADRLLDAAASEAVGGRLWATLVDAEDVARFYRSRGWRDAPPAWTGVDTDDVLVAPAPSPAPTHSIASSRTVRHG